MTAQRLSKRLALLEERENPKIKHVYLSSDDFANETERDERCRELESIPGTHVHLANLLDTAREGNTVKTFVVWRGRELTPLELEKERRKTVAGLADTFEIARPIVDEMKIKFPDTWGAESIKELYRHGII